MEEKTAKGGVCKRQRSLFREKGKAMFWQRVEKSG